MKGMSTQSAPKGNEWLATVAQNLSAAGSTQGTATPIPAVQDCSIFTSVSAGQGCVMPGSGVSIGEEYIVANHGANALKIYPAGTTAQIGTGGAQTAYSLAAGTAIRLIYLGPYGWTQGG